MPNWCENNLTISHPDAEKMQQLRDIVEKGEGFLSEIMPCPKELTETIKGSFTSGTYEQELLELKSKLNIKWFGYANWYDWTVANWGTKWDFCDMCLIDSNTSQEIFLSFNTAWSPPIEAYEKLTELGYQINATYFEGGCGFCGRWNDGSDEYYDIEGDSKWVIENIPADLDDEYCISEGMAEYEEEEA